jgi:hypothetical protein
MITLVALILASISTALNVAKIDPADVPTFIIDFDKPPTERYIEMFEHFKDDMIQVSNHFYRVMTDEQKAVF